MAPTAVVANPIIVEAQANFALNLLRDVSKNGAESTIVSPISVAIALSMCYAGAKEETNQEIGQLLANGAPEQSVHEYFGHMLKMIQNGQKNYTLEVANKVYVKSGFPLLDSFKSAINNHYGGQFESVNFAENVVTAKKINQFVEHATHDKIRDLIQSDMLDGLTRLVLVNAIYFKGNWANKFNAKATEKKPFYVSEGNQKQIDMMHKTGGFIYSEDNQLQLLGMPYVGKEVYMFVLLPKERFGLAKMLENLDGKKLMELVAKKYNSEVVVTLPKFKLESTLPLNEPLKKLGMPTAFGDSANFEGITAAESLQISQVLQKAFIEVNEEGTEAAAATAVKFAFKSLPPPKPEFLADHPFAFLLISTADHRNLILFNGIFRN